MRGEIYGIMVPLNLFGMKIQKHQKPSKTSCFEDCSPRFHAIMEGCTSTRPGQIPVGICQDRPPMMPSAPPLDPSFVWKRRNALWIGWWKWVNRLSCLRGISEYVICWQMGLIRSFCCRVRSSMQWCCVFFDDSGANDKVSSVTLSGTIKNIYLDVVATVPHRTCSHWNPIPLL